MVIQQFQPISENSQELKSLDGLDGYAYLRILAGQIGRLGGLDVTHRPPVGQRCPIHIDLTIPEVYFWSIMQ